MQTFPHIAAPASDTDIKGAHRVFEEFLELYQPALARVEYYLEQILEQVAPPYADAYRPWYRSLHDLFRGVYLTAKDIPLPNPDNFLEALRTFTFESAIQFLHDICLSCRMKLQSDWIERFREHINLLLFSAAILNRQNEPTLSR